MFFVAPFCFFDRKIGLYCYIDDLVESFCLVDNFWNLSDYVNNWVGSLNYFLDDESRASILITDIQDAGVSSGITYWSFMKADGHVRVRQSWKFDRLLIDLYDFSSIEKMILADYEPYEGSDRISEWTVSMDEIENYVTFLICISDGLHKRKF
jgi:hypothetical protein